MHRYVIIYSDSFMVYKINIHIVHFWQNNETANDRIFCYITLHNHISLNYMNTQMQVFKTKIIFLSLIFGTLFVHSVLLTKTFFYCVDRFSTISPYLSEQTQLVLVSSAVFQWLTTWPAERFHSTSWCTQSFPVLMCSSRTSGNKQNLALWWLWYVKHFFKVWWFQS